MKFTKNGVVVNDGKLSFLQKKHVARRVERDSEYLDSFVSEVSDIVTKPSDGVKP